MSRGPLHEPAGLVHELLHDIIPGIAASAGVLPVVLVSSVDKPKKHKPTKATDTETSSGGWKVGTGYGYDDEEEEGGASWDPEATKTVVLAKSLELAQRLTRAHDALRRIVPDPSEVPDLSTERQLELLAAALSGSALVPCLESFLRLGSILHMAEQPALAEASMRILALLASHPCLHAILRCSPGGGSSLCKLLSEASKTGQAWRKTKKKAANKKGEAKGGKGEAKGEAKDEDPTNESKKEHLPPIPENDRLPTAAQKHAAAEVLTAGLRGWCTRSESTTSIDCSTPSKLVASMEWLQVEHPAAWQDETPIDDVASGVPAGVTEEDVGANGSSQERKAYEEVLKELMLDEVDLNDAEDDSPFHYLKLWRSQGASGTDRMARIAHEIASMATNLPSSWDSSCVVRIDEEQSDAMRFMIAGPTGTPYESGLFLFDTLLPERYPQEAPMCNLMTTGGGAIRFNPNLYSCGKVCLSLLGTWQGSAEESWDPAYSSVLQLIISIQSLILIDAPYFNEPGYEREQGSEEGHRHNSAYANIIRYGTVKYGMLGHLLHPPRGFEALVTEHFTRKAGSIRTLLAKWLADAESDEQKEIVEKGGYEGLVRDHNGVIADLFSKEQISYKEHLQKEIAALTEQLDKLNAA